PAPPDPSPSGREHQAGHAGAHLSLVQEPRDGGRWQVCRTAPGLLCPSVIGERLPDLHLMPAAPEIDAGFLDKRITLLRPIYNQFEDEITDWEGVTDVLAGINPQFGQEMNTAGRTVMTVMVPIVIRYRTDIDARWRVQHQTVTYRIQGILDIAKRHIQLQLICDEVQ